jgi:hypothetical protein
MYLIVNTRADSCQFSTLAALFVVSSDHPCISRYEVSDLAVEGKLALTLGTDILSLTNERWRWIFWVLTILHGTVVILCLFAFPETNAMIILDRKAKLSGERGIYLRSPMENGLPPKQVIRQYMTRPLKVFPGQNLLTFKMLVSNPIVLGMSMLRNQHDVSDL